MAITGIHHFNIRVNASELESLQAFYRDVVGLNIGPRPAFRSSGVWLYAGLTPLLHLTEMYSGEAVAPSAPQYLPDVHERHSAIDHIAFASDDMHGALKRFTAHKIVYTVTEVPGAGEIQIFFRDPSGNGVELIFPLNPKKDGAP